MRTPFRCPEPSPTCGRCLRACCSRWVGGSVGAGGVVGACLKLAWMEGGGVSSPAEPISARLFGVIGLAGWLCRPA